MLCYASPSKTLQTCTTISLVIKCVHLGKASSGSCESTFHRQDSSAGILSRDQCRVRPLKLLLFWLSGIVHGLHGQEAEARRHSGRRL